MTSDLPNSERVLVLMPRGRDAELAARVLGIENIEATVCRDAAALVREIGRGAGAVLVAGEGLPPRGMRLLADVLDKQPTWSELPIIIFSAPGVDGGSLPSLGPLETRHFSVLDRPLRVKILVSATRSALRWRKRQYEVRHLMEELESRVQERDKFLAILGHELRNPLAAILLASQMSEGEDQQLSGEHAELIERQSRHLTRLVDDLLDLSRVTAGKIVLQRRDVDLNVVVRHALTTTAETAAKSQVAVAFEEGSSPLLVYGDPVRVDQIVLNLLTNAIKYTQAGGSVTIRASRRSDTATLVIEDTGVGIAPERIDSIFGLFTQAENAIGRAQGGMGIGLSLVRSLVELHGGTVKAQSAGVGKGSVFTLSLPMARSRTTEARVSSSPQGVHERTPRSIVIVEDNPDVRMLLQLKLKRLGHNVQTAGEGEEGIALICRVRPELALVDIGLPGIDGYGVAQEVRGSDCAEIYMVALSGFGQPEDKKRAIDAGFNEHMTKPADVKDLEELLERLPSRNEAAE